MRFQGEVQDGKVVWYDATKAAEFVRGLEGQRVAIDIEAWKALHSDRQRKFYFGVVLPAMAERTGFEKEESDAILRGLFLTVEKNGHRFPRSISTLSKPDFAAFLDRVIRWMATELEVVIDG